MTSKFDKFRALPAPEQRLLAMASLAMPLFWLGLRTVGFARFQGWLERQRGGTPGASTLPPASVARLVDLAARFSPCPATCLVRSMLLSWMLRRRGIHGRLRIGVKLSPVGLDAHAWVEHDGQPLNDTHDVANRYSAFDGPISLNAFEDAGGRLAKAAAK